MVTEPPGVECVDVARPVGAAVVVVVCGGAVVVVVAGGAVVDVVCAAAVVDDVAGLADGARVVLVVDWPTVEVTGLEVEVVDSSGTD